MTEKDTMPTLHERIVLAAYPLFIQRGIRDVTVGEITEAAHVTTAEFDREFTSRDELAAVCLDRRERTWTVGVVEAGARARSTTAEGRLLAIFDVFDDWFQRDDYEACTFINVLLEMGREHPLGRASIQYLVHIRELVGALAAEAHLKDVDEFTLSWHILMKGSIINAVEGDRNAALRAQAMAADLIARHRPSVGRAQPQDTTGLDDFDWLHLYGVEAGDFSTDEQARAGGEPPLCRTRTDTAAFDVDIDFLDFDLRI